MIFSFSYMCPKPKDHEAVALLLPQIVSLLLFLIMFILLAAPCLTFFTHFLINIFFTNKYFILYQNCSAFSLPLLTLTLLCSLRKIYKHCTFFSPSFILLTLNYSLVAICLYLQSYPLHNSNYPFSSLQ